MGEDGLRGNVSTEVVGTPLVELGGSQTALKSFSSQTSRRRRSTLTSPAGMGPEPGFSRALTQCTIGALQLPHGVSALIGLSVGRKAEH